MANYQNQPQGGYQNQPQGGYQQRPQAGYQGGYQNRSQQGQGPDKRALWMQVPPGSHYAVRGTIGYNKIDHWYTDGKKTDFEGNTYPYITLTVNDATAAHEFGCPESNAYIDAVIAGNANGRFFYDRFDKTGQMLPDRLPDVYVSDPDGEGWVPINLEGYLKDGLPVLVVFDVFATQRGTSKGVNGIYLGSAEQPVYPNSDIYAASGGAAALNDISQIMGVPIKAPTQAQRQARGASQMPQPDQDAPGGYDQGYDQAYGQGYDQGYDQGGYVADMPDSPNPYASVPPAPEGRPVPGARAVR